MAPWAEIVVAQVALEECLLWLEAVMLVLGEEVLQEAEEVELTEEELQKCLQYSKQQPLAPA